MAATETAPTKAIRITSTAVLSLLLGVAAPAACRQEQHGEKQDHPDKQGRHEEARPEQQHAQQQRQPDQRQQQPLRAQEQQRQDQNNQQQHAQQHSVSSRARGKSIAHEAWESDHRTWQQRGGYRGYRIPDDRFSGGKPYPLTHFVSEFIVWFAWSKDGKQIAIARGTGSSDAVMITNFR